MLRSTSPTTFPTISRTISAPSTLSHDDCAPNVAPRESTPTREPPRGAVLATTRPVSAPPSYELQALSRAQFPVAAAPARIAATPMSSKEITQTLKARNIILHGAHIFHVGIPAIMALAAAYATDRISRGTFFSALNLFVACGHCNTDKPRGIKAEHLVALGIPKADADRLPLICGSFDFWIVAGLFNGVLDMEDFVLLRDPANKGRFWERHFGPSPSQGVDGLPACATNYNDWVEPSLFSHLGTFTSCPTELAIKATCVQLERSWRGLPCYTSTDHYVLRLEAAARKGQRFSLLGPYNSQQQMTEAFHDIFSIVDADYEGPSTAAELDGFVFTEPAVVPSKFASRTSIPTGYTTRPPIQCTLV